MSRLQSWCWLILANLLVQGILRAADAPKLVVLLGCVLLGLAWPWRLLGSDR